MDLQINLLIIETLLFFFSLNKIPNTILIAIFREIWEIVYILESFLFYPFLGLRLYEQYTLTMKKWQQFNQKNSFFGNCCCKWRKMRCFFFSVLDAGWYFDDEWRKKNNTPRILLLFHIPFVWMCAIWRYIYTLHKHNTLMWRIPKTIWIQYRSFDCHRWRCIPKNTPFYREQWTIV